MESKYEFAAGKETPPRESSPHICGFGARFGYERA